MHSKAMIDPANVSDETSSDSDQQCKDVMTAVIT